MDQDEVGGEYWAGKGEVIESFNVDAQRREFVRLGEILYAEAGVGIRGVFILLLGNWS